MYSNFIAEIMNNFSFSRILKAYKLQFAKKMTNDELLNLLYTGVRMIINKYILN